MSSFFKWTSFKFFHVRCPSFSQRKSPQPRLHNSYSSHSAMFPEIFRLSLVYFSLVFACGFLLGSIRVPFIQPALGVRYAELLETPFMICGIWKSAQHITRRMTGDRKGRATSTISLLTGVLAFVWLAVVEITTTAFLKGGLWNGVQAYVFGRDPVAGPVYGLTLLAYALMPWYMWYRQVQDDDRAISESIVQ